MTSPIYLDHNATTPVDPRVAETMRPHLAELFGNPSSIEHVHGHSAHAAVETARAQVAGAIGAQPNEIVFTGSCTEADNLALFGVAATAGADKRHLVVSAIEHPAILEPARALEARGWRVTRLAVDAEGLVDPAAVSAAIAADTALVSVMGANNEVGAVQSLTRIGEICAERNVLFHSDLAQLPAYGGVDVIRDNLHLASLSAHKAYGPKGVGALYVRARRPRVRLAPLIHGGGQERGLRPGTLNTLAIVGMGAALEIARADHKADAARLESLCRRFWGRFAAEVDGALLNGPPLGARLANNLSISVPGVEPLALMRQLNDRVSFSASSACATDKIETSPVLMAMFGDGPRARTAFRVSPGRFTTEAEMDQAAEMLAAECRRLRKFSVAATATA